MRCNLIFPVLIVLVLFLSACNGGGGFDFSSFGFGGSSTPSGSGVNIKFVEAPKSGEVFSEGDTFSILLKLENGIPGINGVAGNICLRDGTTDTYGGIPSNNCRPINLRPADISNSKIFPSVDEARFPETGFYSYKNLDPQLSLDNQIYADFNYNLETNAIGTICIARPHSTSSAIPSGCSDDQTLSLSQPSGVPISADVKVSKSRVDENNIRLTLLITLRNTLQGHILRPGNLESPSSNEYPEIGFDGFISQFPIDCSSIRNGYVEFRQSENEKVIKCTASINLPQDYLQVPLSLKLRYGYTDTILGPKIKLKGAENIL